MTLRKGRTGRLACLALFRRGTGPSPGLRSGSESGCHGVLFDVADGSELNPVTNPAIKGLFLPKGLAGKAEYLVGVAGRRPLQPAGYRTQRDFRGDQDVYVVRHDDPCVKSVKPSFIFSRFDCVCDEIGDSGVLRPTWSESCSVEFSILGDESVSGPGIGSQNIRASNGRQRSMQSPGQKIRRSVRLKMGHSSSVFGHRGLKMTGGTACPTYQSAAGGGNSHAFQGGSQV